MGIAQGRAQGRAFPAIGPPSPLRRHEGMCLSGKAFSSPSGPALHHGDLADTMLARQSGTASISQQPLKPPRGGQRPLVGSDEPPRSTSKSILSQSAERVLLRPMFVESLLQMSRWSELQNGLQQGVMHERHDENGLCDVRVTTFHRARPDVLSPYDYSFRNRHREGVKELSLLL